MLRLFFASIICLLAAGCANRRTTVTVFAEGSAHERSCLYEGGVSGRIAYRIQTEPTNLRDHEPSAVR